jgi:hypothetical protein
LWAVAEVVQVVTPVVEVRVELLKLLLFRFPELPQEF